MGFLGDWVFETHMFLRHNRELDELGNVGRVLENSDWALDNQERGFIKYRWGSRNRKESKRNNLI